MKNYKQLIIGIVIGSFVTSGIAIATEYVITKNPYPVTINGASTTIEGYNINDKTYFQLRDIGDKVGFEVAFKDNTINVTTSDKPTITPTPSQAPATPAPTYAPIDTSKNTPNPKMGYRYMPEGQQYTSDGLAVDIIDGIKYVSVGEIQKLYNIKAYGYAFGTTQLYNINNNYEVVIDNIPYETDKGAYINLNYYENIIQPFLIEHCK